MDEKKKQGYPSYDDDKYYDIEAVASSQDCTGLVPTPPKDEAAADSYSDLYNIPQPKGEVNNGLQNIKKTKNNEN